MVFQLQKLFLYQLLFALFLFNARQGIYAQGNNDSLFKDQNKEIPVFDETDDGMSDGEIAGLVAGSVAGLAVGAGAIAVGVKKYQDNKNNKSSEKVSSDLSGLSSLSENPSLLPRLPNGKPDSSQLLRDQEEKIAQENEDQERSKKIQDIDKEVNQLQRKKKELLLAGVNKPGNPKREKQIEDLDQRMEVLRNRKRDYQPSESGKEQKSMFKSVAEMQARSLIDEESQKKVSPPVRPSPTMPASRDNLDLTEETEKVSPKLKKIRVVLDDTFGEEAQKKEQRDQENKRRLDEKQNVYDDVRAEWKKADKALQDMQKQLVLYKNAPDINSEAKLPVIEATQKEIDRLYKIMIEKQRALSAPEKELKAVQEEIKQGYQEEEKALDATVEKSDQRISEYKSRAAVVAEQQKIDEKEVKQFQKELNKKQQALQDAGMELQKARKGVFDAGEKLRNIQNAHRYIEYETDEIKKAEAEAKVKKAKETFEERKAAVGRAQVHANRLADDVDAIEQKIQEIKLRPQVQEAVRLVVDDLVVDERKKMRPVSIEENPMHPVLKDLPIPDELKSNYAKRQLMQDNLTESNFKAQQDEEARLKKIAEDQRTNKKKKEQNMVIGKSVFVRVGNQPMPSEPEKNIASMKKRLAEKEKLSQAELSKKKLAESIEDANLKRARDKKQKNKKSITGPIARKIRSRY